MPDLLAVGRNALQMQQRHERVEPRIGRCRAVESVLTCVLRGPTSPQACGCASNGCVVAAGSATGVAPWPSPAVTKLDAMNWPSRAAACTSLLGGAHRGLDVDVVAGAPVEDVLARTTDQHVVACVAVQDVVAGAADQDVVAVAAIGGELDACQTGRLDHVVAAEAIDDDAVLLSKLEIVTVSPDPSQSPRRCCWRW